MINARVPSFVIRVIGNFYSKLRGLAYWNGAFSNEFKKLSGTRQGGYFLLYYITYTLWI